MLTVGVNKLLAISDCYSSHKVKTLLTDIVRLLIRAWKPVLRDHILHLNSDLALKLQNNIWRKMV